MGGGEDGSAVGERGEVSSVEEAVEASQLRGLTSPDELDAAVKHPVGQSPVAQVREEAAVAVSEEFGKSVFVVVSRLVELFEGLCERGRGGEPVGFEAFELFWVGSFAEFGLDLVEQPP